jgi:3',5'-cyclic AMP phosphodiesterase CpdA
MREGIRPCSANGRAGNLSHKNPCTKDDSGAQVHFACGVNMIRNTVLRIILYLVFAALAVALLYKPVSGFLKNQPKLQYAYNLIDQDIVPYPDTRFAVISDIHYYDPSLGTTGQAFEDCLYSDRKLLRDSPALLDLAIDDIILSNVEFVLIPGDLTKDGELVCHQKAAAALSKLTQQGIKVYVVPGNHDINNPSACEYQESQTFPAANITAVQFSDIYNNCGYGSAVCRDPNSLSYVVEPVKDLWIVALDTCCYQVNEPGKEVTIEGKLSQRQEKWLEEVLRKANQSGKALMVMVHHGVAEHWTGQSKLHPDYLIQDYFYVGKLLASYYAQLVFSGHYHAQDITMAEFNGSGCLYDIESGSLITAPCPIRYCTIKGNTLDIKSKNLAGELHPATDYEDKAEQFLFDTVEREAFSTIRRYHVPQDDALSIAGFVSEGFVAHYMGDEDVADKPDFDESKLGLWSRAVYSAQKYVVDGLWQDLPPDDNNLTLDL